jgi:uncharacterized protein (TIGR02284 family)
MALETKTHLDETTIKELQGLARVNVDSADGFRFVAKHVNNLTLEQAFLRIADQREMQAQELADFIQWNGKETMVEGSFAAMLHRTWISIREKLTSDNVYVMLAEAERGEDQIKEAYESAILRTAGSAMNDVLLRQLTEVKANHDFIRDLRDEQKLAQKVKH